MASKETIEKLIKQQEAISHRNYMAYQETGISRYMRAHERAEDLIDICRMAMNVADIKQQNGIMRAELTEFAHKAIMLDHNQRWLDPENLGDVGGLIKNLAGYGRMIGVNDPWRE